MAARKWTVEQRQQQSEAIRRWKPWEQSTGPQSAEGKAKASRNGWTGGHLVLLRQITKNLNQALKAQREMLRS